MNITPTIVCLYTCKRCGLTKVPVTVPAREAEQDIVEFTKATVALLGVDHERINPDCPARELDVHLPISDDVIGGATRQ